MFDRDPFNFQEPARSPESAASPARIPEEPVPVAQKAVKAPRKQGKKLPFRRDQIPRLVPREKVDLKSHVDALWDRSGEGSPKRSRTASRVAVAAIILGLAVVTFQVWRTMLAARQQPRILETSASGGGSEELAGGEESEASARQIAEAFLAAASVEEQLPLVRDSGLEPQMRTFRKSLGDAESEVDFLRPLERGQSQDVIYTSFHARFRSGRNRLLCVVENPGGGLAVDWEAYARRGSASWDELLWGHVKEAEVRVLAQPGRMFDGVFNDAKKFAGFTLTSPDLEAPVYGYIPRGSRTLQIMDSILKERRAAAMQAKAGQRLPYAGLPPVRMTLVIASENESYGSKQFRIGRIVADGWVKSTWGDLEDTWVAPEAGSEDTIEDMADRIQREKARANRRTRNFIVP